MIIIIMITTIFRAAATSSAQDVRCELQPRMLFSVQGVEGELWEATASAPECLSFSIAILLLRDKIVPSTCFLFWV
jgi:hypothetical protein